MTRRRTVPAAFAAVAALLCAAPAGAGAPRPKSVEVADNYYLPLKLTLKQGARVTWKWPDDIAIDVHDVKLKSGPKGVKKFQSEPASSGYEYKRTFKKPGTYKIVCTLHEEMTMTIKVKRSSGSPSNVAPERPAAGAARQGRRPAGIPLSPQRRPAGS